MSDPFRGMKFNICLMYPRRIEYQYVLTKDFQFKPYKEHLSEALVFPDHSSAKRFIELLEDPHPLICLAPCDKRK